MRALLDANLFISHLLTPPSSGSIAGIFEALVAERFTLLLPEELMAEIVDVITNRPHLAGRINLDRALSFMEALPYVAEIVPPIEQIIPAIGRDVKDDYLVAYAVVGQADYLVTGDKDLLVLGEVVGLTIINPVEFAALLANRQT